MLLMCIVHYKLVICLYVKCLLQHQKAELSIFEMRTETTFHLPESEYETGGRKWFLTDLLESRKQLENTQ